MVRSISPLITRCRTIAEKEFDPAIGLGFTNMKTPSLQVWWYQHECAPYFNAVHEQHIAYFRVIMRCTSSTTTMRVLEFGMGCYHVCPLTSNPSTVMLRWLLQCFLRGDSRPAGFFSTVRKFSAKPLHEGTTFSVLLRGLSGEMLMWLTSRVTLSRVATWSLNAWHFSTFRTCEEPIALMKKKGLVTNPTEDDHDQQSQVTPTKRFWIDPGVTQIRSLTANNSKNVFSDRQRGNSSGHGQ